MARLSNKPGCHVRRAIVPICVGLLCLIVTRWLVAGLLGGLAAATLPSSLRKAQPGATAKKAEAVTTWTELIRDALAASAGLRAGHRRHGSVGTHADSNTGRCLGDAALKWRSAGRRVALLCTRGR